MIRIYRSAYALGSLIFLAAFLLLFCSATSPEKKLVGHWINEADLYDMRLNDTLTFTKVEYREALYHWGGAPGGIEMDNKHGFAEYHNVMCSTESNPVRFTDEKWEMKDDRISIIGNSREIEWKILKAAKKQLTVVVTKLNIHEQ